MRVATALRHLSELELLRAVQRGEAYVDGDTVVPVAAGGAGFETVTGSRFQSPDFSGNTVISVASAAAAGTKGAWTQLLASTSFDTDWMIVGAAWGTSGRTALIDLGVGGSGAEVAIVTDLPYEQSSGVQNGTYLYTIPIPIPAGTRISARANISGATTKNVPMWVQPIAGGYQHPWELHRVISLGTTTTPALTSLDPGGTAGTKGAWVALTTSAPADLKAIMLVTSKPNTAAAIDWKVDLGVGASGAEQVVISNYYCSLGSTGSPIVQPSVSPIIPLNVPAGARISARCSASIITAGTRTLNVAVLGLC